MQQFHALKNPPLEMLLKPQPEGQNFGTYQLDGDKKKVAVPTNHVHDPVDLHGF